MQTQTYLHDTPKAFVPDCLGVYHMPATATKAAMRLMASLGLGFRLRLMILEGSL